MLNSRSTISHIPFFVGTGYFSSSHPKKSCLSPFFYLSDTPLLPRKPGPSEPSPLSLRAQRSNLDSDRKSEAGGSGGERRSGADFYFPNSRAASSSRLNSKCSATSARMPERVPTRSGLWLGMVR